MNGRQCQSCGAALVRRPPSTDKPWNSERLSDCCLARAAALRARCGDTMSAGEEGQLPPAKCAWLWRGVAVMPG